MRTISHAKFGAGSSTRVLAKVYCIRPHVSAISMWLHIAWSVWKWHRTKKIMLAIRHCMKPAHAVSPISHAYYSNTVQTIPKQPTQAYGHCTRLSTMVMSKSFDCYYRMALIRCWPPMQVSNSVTIAQFIGILKFTNSLVFMV